jgi:enamine deaminase RidA (YjgF/YER057c/UK114 family)
MPGRIDQRLAELKIELPNPASPLGSYIPAVQTGNLLYLSGQICHWNGERRYLGKLGAEVSVEDGKAGARLCGLNLLAQAKRYLGGDLDRVVRIVRLGGFVNAVPSFTDQPSIVNGASDLMVEVFGDAGKHARTAVGVGSLPGNASVEVDMILEIK